MTGKPKVFYAQEVLKSKINFYKNLPEKQRRHFLGQECLHLGARSQRYLSRVFSCSRGVIIRGKKEVSASDFNPNYSSQRKKGGGAKKKKKICLH